MSDDRRVFGPFVVDGTDRHADPLRVHRRLSQATAGQLAKLLDDARQAGPDDAEGDDEAARAQNATARLGADQVAFPAIEELLRATLYAFELPAFDPATGQGMTEKECQQLLHDFLGWLAEERDFFVSTPTSVPPTGPVSSPSPSAKSTASGSTSKGRASSAAPK